MAESPASPPQRSLNWILADCPSCSKTMKIRREMVGPRAFLCPNCRAPISIEFTNPESAKAASDAQKQAAERKGRYGKPLSNLARTPVPTGKKTSTTSTEGTAPAYPPPTPLPLHQPTESAPENPQPAAENTPVSPSASTGTILPPSRTQLKFSGNSTESPKNYLGQINPNVSASGDRALNSPGQNSLDEAFRSKLRTIDKLEPAPNPPLGGQRRVRHSQRGKLADWNSELSHVPEAEAQADLWDEKQVPADGTDRESFVTNVMILDGQQIERVRHTSRRKRLKGWARIFDFASRMSWYIAGFFMLLLLGGGAWLMMGVSNQKVTTDSTSIASMSSLAKEVRISRRTELSAADMESALEVTKQFYAAPNWKERMAFCRRPDETREKMEQWYDKHPDSALTVHGYREIEGGPPARKEFIQEVGFFIFLNLEVGPERINRYVALEEIPMPAGEKSKYLVDWESTVGYAPMEIYDYKVSQPRSPLDFRVLMSPCGEDAYYNHEFNDEKEWKVYRLTNALDPDFFLFGYVKRGSDTEKEIDELFHADLSIVKCNLILRLRYPEKAVSRDQVEIVKLVNPSWYFPRREAVPGFQ